VNDDLVRRLIEYFQSRSEGLAAVYLYGSIARGTARPDSDVDIGLLLTRTAPSTLDSQPYDVEADLERLLGRTVQVVELNRAPVDLRVRVLRDGRLLVDLDRSARIRFEVQTRNEAFDLEPFLSRYRAAPGRGR
jgi:predicted nucleotidyltransferase